MGTSLGRADRWILASFATAAGIIHAVMAPSHMGASTLEGGGFVVAAWLQLALAVGIVTRPSRGMLRLVLAVNAVLVGVWAVSRTVGLPFGAHADHAETISFVDGSCVAFELIMVGLAAVWLWRPAMVRFKDGAFAVAVPLAVFGLATAAISSPEARDHSAHAHAGHGPADHDHGTTPTEDDKGLSLVLNGRGHEHAGPDVELDTATQAKLTAQLSVTAKLIEKYPTLGAAVAAGAWRAGPFGPAVGAHYAPPDYEVNTDGVLDDADLLTPLLVFDGTGPDAPIAGFMYYMLGADQPEGFAGPNDHWHQHTNMCLVTYPDDSVDAPFGADNSWVTEEMCTNAGGELEAISGSMLHVWTVPSYTPAAGVFSDVNPKITCPDGTYYMVDFTKTKLRDTACRDS